MSSQVERGIGNGRLPVDAVVKELREALARDRAAVLQAPPGAGKTTRIPLAVLDEGWLAGRRILLLEPRRLAARAAACRMAGMLGEDVGETVGYRVRLDSRIGPRTRIEVVTEGILTRMVQSDPALAGIGLVIFDEFHERHLETDLGFALCLDVQGVFNDSLRLLVMSATLDAAPAAELMGGAAVIGCAGHSFAVETRYRGRRSDRTIEREVGEAVLAAAAREAGGILVFLPGAPEIRRVEHHLRGALPAGEFLIVPLYGNLGRVEQDRAIAPSPPGFRKIVLATTIAETSLTIEGIRVVVDGGLARVPRYDVRNGMSRLETLPVSQASADQRRGRAGRSEPGVCYRLWTEAAHANLAPFNRPEILESDLAGLALELALWGVDDPGRLAWLDPPPAAAFEQARKLLQVLGALEAGGRITERGRTMAELPLHPRLAYMLLAASKIHKGGLACELAAVVAERDFLRFAAGQYDADLRLRVELLQRLQRGGVAVHPGCEIDRRAARRVLKVADRLRNRLGIRDEGIHGEDVGRLLAWAYPDRIGLRRAGTDGRFLLSGGQGACFDRPEPLGAADCLVAAELDGERREARIYRAAACDRQTLLEQFADRLRWEERIEWDPHKEAVKAERRLRLGALVVKTESLEAPDPKAVAAALLEGIRKKGIVCLPWTRDLQRWRERVGFLRETFGEEQWPDVSEAGLLASLEEWLTPHLAGITRVRDLTRVDLRAALQALLTPERRRRLEELAPTHLTVPSGSRIPVDYSTASPVLAVRLQEMFGTRETPRVAGGRQPLLLHLLSPAGRPVQVTGDLEGFWRGSYQQVRRELKGRYPKHPWPEDPLAAQPTSRAKPKAGRIR